MPRPANPFRELYGMGYRKLVPIIPPDAEISPTSSFAKRGDARGKAVGVRGYDGLWRGYDWLKAPDGDETDFDRWHAMGCGVGIRTGDQGDGNSLVGIDADTTVADLAEKIRETIDARFGKLPVRVGQKPKALYPIRVKGLFKYARIEFGGPNARGLLERVELLSDGKQFVAAGVHPGTREPYRWLRPLVPFEALPLVLAAREP